MDVLLQAGANVEVSGMHCWTPLLVSARENAAEIVNRLLEKKPNVNATDKDGCTALSLACKEGYYDICIALLAAGAYVNLQDRSGDTNLIHAAKAGHKAIVEALLKKYADVDMTGKVSQWSGLIAIQSTQLLFFCRNERRPCTGPWRRTTSRWCGRSSRPIRIWKSPPRKATLRS